MVTKQLSNVPSTSTNPYVELEGILKGIVAQKNITKAEQARLEYELIRVKKWGIAKVFLFGLELMSSGSNIVTYSIDTYSYISYLLGISSVNPTLYDLPFERFFNSYRTSLPSFCLYIKKSDRPKLFKTIYKNYKLDTIVRASDNIGAYFVSSKPIDKDVIKERRMVGDSRDGYEENISSLSRFELSKLGFYCFDVIDVEDVRRLPERKIEEPEIYDTARNHIFSYKIPSVPPFTEIDEVKKILKDTEYKLVYQEQVIKLLSELLGVDLELADHLRREIAKRKIASYCHVEDIFYHKFGKAGERLYQYLEMQTIYTVSKAYVISKLQYEVDFIESDPRP